MDKKYNINYIADKYEFDEQYEVNIYKYLCFKRLKKKAEKKMNESVKFITYDQWKRYINDKYKNFTYYDLNEFSHFLNQRIRNISPELENWKLVIPVILALFAEEFFQQIINLSNIPFNSILQVFIELILLVGVIISSVFVVEKIFEPTWWVSDRKNFYMDYKEIIDEMLKEKMKKEDEPTID